MSLLLRIAREFAVSAHGDQKYGDQPYWVHLDEVAALAEHLRAPLAVQVAAFLHDILEDTDTSEEELRAAFGEEVTSLVVAVTKIPGLLRKEGLRKNLNKVYSAGPNARLLKLCDRIANVRACKANNPGLFDMYRREGVVFREILGVPGEHQEAWKLYELAYQV